MFLTFTNVDINRSPEVIDSGEIDYITSGLIQGTVIFTKSENSFNVLEDVETVSEMWQQAKELNNA